MAHLSIKRTMAALGVALSLFAFHRKDALTTDVHLEGAVYAYQNSEAISDLSDKSLLLLQHMNKRPWLYGLKMNVNVVDSDALIDLPGIGPKLSKRIIVHRKRHGLFLNEADSYLLLA